MLWVDKYRPTRLDALDYHANITERLTSLSNDKNIPHLLFYGPSGAGKKTRINALLRSIYGAPAEKLRLSKRIFKTPTNREVEINMICSNVHIEMSPGDAGIYDRYVIQDVIKEMASNKALNSSMYGNSKQQQGDASGSNVADFKVVVLNEVDSLSKQAQASLRRTMEKYTSSCRLILCCSNQSKVIEPVRSRCLGIRVSAPSVDDIVRVLKVVARKEQFTLPDELAVNIARESDRNLRRAVLMLEASKVQQNVLSADQPVQKTDWELYISQIAVDIVREQSPQRLLSVREKFYELLVNCIPADVILKTLAIELIKNLDDTLKAEVIEWAAFYEHRVCMGSKEIFHLEAFVAKFMAVYKAYINSMFDDDF